MQTLLTCSPRHRALLILALVTLLGGAGCKDLIGTSGLPSGTPDPATYSTPQGAVGMFTAAVAQFQGALPQYIMDVGLLTDELEDQSVGASRGVQIENGFNIVDPLDERILPEGSLTGAAGTSGGAIDYGNLQKVRAVADQALGALAAYDTGAKRQGNPAAMRAELYALEGYTEIMLADFFCSGVPLSTLDFQHDFTYRPSSTTAQVYQAAVAKFDTALALGAGNDTIVNLARVGKGRALLDLDSAAAAAIVVTPVPDGFAFADTMDFYFLGSCGTATCIQGLFSNVAMVADREGGNGLPYISSGDPRTAVSFVDTTRYGDSAFFPLKYSASVTGSFTAHVPLASWIDARLIEAEAALRAGDAATMLGQLNYLRQHATVPGMTGTLPTLADPGTDSARVTLLFQERAYWLFLTGNRQGDLRRQLRQYSQYRSFQSQNFVYPTGQYSGLGVGLYGSDVTVPIPAGEDYNPLFHGCLSREP